MMHEDINTATDGYRNIYGIRQGHGYKGKII